MTNLIKFFSNGAYFIAMCLAFFGAWMVLGSLIVG